MNYIELCNNSWKFLLSWYLIKQKAFLNLTLIFSFLYLQTIAGHQYGKLLSFAVKIKEIYKKIFKKLEQKQFNTKWTNMVEMKKLPFLHTCMPSPLAPDPIRVQSVSNSKPIEIVRWHISFFLSH